MKDIQGMLADLRRPSLLIRAARAGLDNYNRRPHLRRVLCLTEDVRPAQTVLQLMEIEAQLNEDRQAGTAHYSVVRYVDVLVALLGEAQLLQQQPS